MFRVLAAGLAALVMILALGGVAAADFTPEQSDKYYNTTVEHDVRQHQVTIYSRRFQGGAANGAERWRQKSIRDVIGGRTRLELGPGEWVTNASLSPWFVYAQEPVRTYSSQVAVQYVFEYYECPVRVDEDLGIQRKECGYWGSGGTYRPITHKIAPLGDGAP